MQLPITAVLPQIRGALDGAQSAVIAAPPGAGKTTGIPPALLGERWLEGRRIVMLEPRRLATRRAAEFMAAAAGEGVGRSVGYRIRGESRVGPETRIEVVTEGILTRMLHDDPSLAGVGMVIFDEFHERSLNADLGLALTIDAQTHLRPDLRILVMSATLNGIPLSRMLADSPIIESHGRAFPVETRYASFRSDRPVEMRVAETIRRALSSDDGDLLVFLPGRREINHVESYLREKPLPEDAAIHCLFGDAGYERQQAALAPDPGGRRKIILSTSIAETSLTIDGVTIVIDSGLARSVTFDPRRGMSGLVTTPVSRATADQRRGRAGRQRPGVCYRLWAEGDHGSLPAFPTPEILAGDLAPLALDLALWGTPLGEGLRFLDPPPPPHLARARDLLKSLGALDDRGALTSHGRAMTQFPLHPRLAHMVIRGSDLGLGDLACDIAALLEERDLRTGKEGSDIDLRSRWESLTSGHESDRVVRERVLAQAARLRAQLGGVRRKPGRENSEIGLLLALAYPERVAKRRGASSRRYQMVSGTGAVLPERSLLHREEFLAVGDVDGVGAEVRIFMAAPIKEQQIVSLFQEGLAREEEVRWNSRTHSVVAREVERLGAIVLKEVPLRPEGEAVLNCMLEGIQEMGPDALPWPQPAVDFRARSEWLRMGGHVSAGWPDLSDAALFSSLSRWLGPFLGGVTKREHLSRIDLPGALRSLFTGEQLREVDRLAPSHYRVPTGSLIRIDYGAGREPVLSVRLQEMFGETETPRIGGGKVPLLLHLLSPARRPLAVTQDLRSFWKNSYQTFRRQMQARYPKHHWPENPLAAAPTRRTKR